MPAQFLRALTEAPDEKSRGSPESSGLPSLASSGPGTLNVPALVQRKDLRLLPGYDAARLTTPDAIVPDSDHSHHGER